MFRRRDIRAHTPRHFIDPGPEPADVLDGRDDILTLHRLSNLVCHISGKESNNESTMQSRAESFTTTS